MRLATSPGIVAVLCLLAPATALADEKITVPIACNALYHDVSTPDHPHMGSLTSVTITATDTVIPVGADIHTVLTAQKVAPQPGQTSTYASDYKQPQRLMEGDSWPLYEFAWAYDSCTGSASFNVPTINPSTAYRPPRAGPAIMPRAYPHRGPVGAERAK